jgi:hypothetical protein
MAGRGACKAILLLLHTAATQLTAEQISSIEEEKTKTASSF